MGWGKPTEAVGVGRWSLGRLSDWGGNRSLFFSAGRGERKPQLGRDRGRAWERRRGQRRRAKGLPGSGGKRKAGRSKTGKDDSRGRLKEQDSAKTVPSNLGVVFRNPLAKGRKWRQRNPQAGPGRPSLRGLVCVIPSLPQRVFPGSLRARGEVETNPRGAGM